MSDWQNQRYSGLAFLLQPSIQNLIQICGFVSDMHAQGLPLIVIFPSFIKKAGNIITQGKGFVFNGYWPYLILC